MSEFLKSLEINKEKGICIVNGTDVSNKCKYLKLEFENGIWTLNITTDRIFSNELPTTEETLK